MFTEVHLWCCQLGSVPGGSLNSIFLQHILPRLDVLVLTPKVQGRCEQGEVHWRREGGRLLLLVVHSLLPNLNGGHTVPYERSLSGT